jgi:hypothetical protein
MQESMYGRISIFGSDIERIEKLWRIILVTGDLGLLPCPLILGASGSPNYSLGLHFFLFLHVVLPRLPLTSHLPSPTDLL